MLKGHALAILFTQNSAGLNRHDARNSARVTTNARWLLAPFIPVGYLLVSGQKADNAGFDNPTKAVS